MIPLQPIQPKLHMNVLDAAQLEAVQSATFELLENVGVRFPSQRALHIFSDHGAEVDHARQIVRLTPDIVLKALEKAPRSYLLAGRTGGTELLLDGSNCYFTTDGCGVETIDFDTGSRRPSCKEDVAKMARVSDYLASIAFYWPMVSPQEYGRAAPLHELDASFRNTVKHVQTETVMGDELAQYSLRMAEVIAGDREAVRKRPPFSSMVCTIAPLSQDKEGVEGAMRFAEAGIPVGFMAMPTMGSTAPATPGGALAVGNAEVVSAMVLMQLVAPGAPVYHSILVSVMDPRTAEYVVSMPDKYLCNAAAVQIAHDWGVPALGGAFGLEHSQPATWVLGRDNVYTALLCSLNSAEMVTGLGMLTASTLLVPEQIIFDDETYHIHRIMTGGINTSPEAMALDVIQSVGPGGHFLAQQHTRRHVRDLWIPELAHPRPVPDGDRDVRKRARARLDRILREHHPEPLSENKAKELDSILKSASRELGPQSQVTAKLG